MRIHGVEVRDAAAEAFPMWAARLVVTARDEGWARRGAEAAAGFATSVIGCDAEAGVERRLSPDETPDGRPGCATLLFTRDRAELERVLVDRIGQAVLTCATAACFDGLPDADRRHDAGRRVAMFGDGFEAAERRGGRTVWRVPVTEGEFVVEETFGLERAVGGGNFLVLARDRDAALEAAEAAAAAMEGLAGVALPFPGGVSRAASKVSARRHPSLPASTHEAFCPGLRDRVEGSRVPQEVGSVLELVVDGLDARAVGGALRAGILAACRSGVVAIDAAEFGGRLGELRFPLRELLEGAEGGSRGEDGR